MNEVVLNLFEHVDGILSLGWPESLGPTSLKVYHGVRHCLTGARHAV